MHTRSGTSFGLIVAGLAFAVLLVAAGQVYHAYQNAGSTAAAVRTPREQVYAVNVETLTAVTVTPVITAYGRLESGRSLEVRSSVAGELVALSDSFQNGGTVAAGELLFQIDPARLETTLALAETDLQESRATLEEARAALELAALDVAAATT